MGQLYLQVTAESTTTLSRGALLALATTDDVGRRTVTSLDNEVGTVANSLYWNNGTTVWPAGSNQFISINGSGSTFDDIAVGTVMVIADPNNLNNYWTGTTRAVDSTAALSGGGTRDTLPVATIESGGTPTGSNLLIYFGSGLSGFNDAPLTTPTISSILIPGNQSDILLDIAAQDNTEVGAVIGDLSQSFIIPPTEEHNRFFESAFDVGGSLIPGTSTGVQASLNSGSETLASGTLTLEGWSEGVGYEVQLNAGVVSLADALDGKLLADADWSDLDHTYSVDTWRAMDIAQSNPSYYYPLIDRGFDSEGRPRIPADEVIAQSTTVTTQPGYGGSYLDTFGNTITGLNGSDVIIPLTYSPLHHIQLD